MRSEQRLSHAFLKAHPRDAARTLEKLPPAALSDYVEHTPARLLAPVLERMLPLSVANFLGTVNPETASALIAGMELVSAGHILRRMPAASRQPVLERLASRPAAMLRRQISYHEHTVGALMNPAAFALPADDSAADALQRIRQTTLHITGNLYLVDEAHHLKGVLSLGELVKSRPGALVSTLMDEQVRALPVNASLDAIIDHPGWRNHYALPVIDAQGSFIGSLRHTRLIEALDEAERRPRAEPAQLLFGFSELCWIGLTAISGELLHLLKRRRPAMPPESDHAS